MADMERTRRSRCLSRVEPFRPPGLGLKGVVNMPIWFRMLRTDNKTQLVKLPWTLSRMLSGRRYAVQSGHKIMELRWSKAQMGAAQTAQATEPVHVWRDGRRNLWQFLDCFYWDDDGLDAEDIKALVLQRKRRLEQKVRSAHSLMRAEEDARPTRVSISTELRRAVFERDGGRCVECDSAFDIQYDHILPVAHGGATTLQNLQILCADCNRRKSDSI
jgi:hypothetical protein